MKRLFLLYIIIGVVTASCSMDHEPYDAIPDSEALQTPTDFANMRNGLYVPLRSMTTGAYLLTGELQCDAFNAVEGFTNAYGDIHRWLFNAGNSEFSTIYGGYYGLAAQCNFIIEGAEKCDTTVFSADDKADVSTTVGEAYFLRAWCYSQLATLYCQDYDETTAETPSTGISIQLAYAPTSNSSVYPGRSSLRLTYQQIRSDLAEAEKRIDNQGSISSNRITTDAIRALRARVALACDNYAEADSLAQLLTSSRRYPLASDAREYKSIWAEDGGTETIMQLPIPSLDELAGTTGSVFLPQTANAIDYLPTQTLIDLYDKNLDIRFEAFFKSYHLTVPSGAEGDVYLFCKYPDSTAVFRQLGRSESARFQSEPKMFRIAEQYLIGAEANARMGRLAQGTNYLNQLRRARIRGLGSESYATAETLLQAIQEERQRELVGEGFRLADLKRWHQGVSRGVPQQASLCLMPGSATTTHLRKPSSDFRMVWPIPQAEMNANPQMDGHQNKGY